MRNKIMMLRIFKIKTKIILFILSLSIFSNSYSYVGIGTTNHERRININSSTNGVVFPKIELTSKNLSAPFVNPSGSDLSIVTVIYNTALPCQTLSIIQDVLDVTFSDAGHTALPCSWSLGSGLISIYKTTGRDLPNTASPSNVIQNIILMTRFNCFSPNGKWSVFFKDNVAFDSATLPETFFCIFYSLNTVYGNYRVLTSNKDMFTGLVQLTNYFQ